MAPNTVKYVFSILYRGVPRLLLAATLTSFPVFLNRLLSSRAKSYVITRRNKPHTILL